MLCDVRILLLILLSMKLEKFQLKKEKKSRNDCICIQYLLFVFSLKEAPEIPSEHLIVLFCFVLYFFF
jgi:hypothetical protein